MYRISYATASHQTTRPLCILLGMVSLFFCASAQANISVGTIIQSPANDVWPVQPVTYTIPVSTDFTTPPVFFNITMTDSANNNITAAFATSSDCNIDIDTFFCGPITALTPPQNLEFTWTPPPDTSTITFTVVCQTQGCADAPPVTVITTVAPPPEPTPDLSTRENLNDTQRATAEALDQLCSTTQNETLQSQCSNLTALSDAQAAIALNQIAPDEVTAQGASSVEIVSTQLSNVRARLASLRQDPSSTMFALKGITLAMNGDTLPVGLLADASDIGSGLGSLIENSRLGLFMNGRINFGEKDSTARETGFDFDTNGITFGLDYWFNSKLVMGGALGYATTDSSFNNNGGNMDSTARSLSFYGSYYMHQNGYIDWIATLGSNDFSTRRTIIYSGVNTLTQGNTGGNQFGLSTTAALDYQIGKLLVSPYLRLDYVNADIKDYRETGGGGLALAIDKQNTKSFTTALAIRVSQAISQRWGVLTPSAHAEWEHEFKDDGRLIIARFVADPTAAFSIPTDNPDRDYFRFGGALSATFPRGKSAYISFGTVVGQDNITSSTLDLGGRIDF